MSSQKIEVLYNGIKIPEKNFYNSQNKTIIFMGVLKKEKGIYDLIDAIKIIDDKIPEEIKVLLCGNDIDGKVKEKIQDLNLNNRVQLLGWIDSIQKDKIYKNAKLNILPSYYEALSMTILEAMSYGVPTITTNISTMNEILDNQEQLISAGDVKMLAEKIMHFLNEDEKLIKISNNEYDRVQKLFSIESNIKATLDIYDELVRSENK